MRMLPNLVTTSRLVLLVPLMLLLVYGESLVAHRLAFALFVVAAATDWLDGWIARRFGCTSNIGIFYDPLVDKIFANVLLIFLAWRYPAWVPPWVVILLVAREFAVQGFRSMAPCKGVVLRTRLVSKLKLLFQLIAAGATLAGIGWPALAGPLRGATWVALALALIAGYGSMVRLFWRNRDLWGRPTVPMDVR